MISSLKRTFAISPCLVRSTVGQPDERASANSFEGGIGAKQGVTNQIGLLYIGNPNRNLTLNQIKKIANILSELIGDISPKKS